MLGIFRACQNIADIWALRHSLNPKYTTLLAEMKDGLVEEIGGEVMLVYSE